MRSDHDAHHTGICTYIWYTIEGFKIPDKNWNVGIYSCVGAITVTQVYIENIAKGKSI